MDEKMKRLFWTFIVLWTFENVWGFHPCFVFVEGEA